MWKASKLGSYTRKKDSIQLLILCSPAILFLIVFNYIPMGGLVIAFKDFRYDLGLFGSKWIGIKNFEFFFASDIAWRLIRNTVGYNVIFIVSTTIASIMLAILLNEITKRRWIKIYQTVMFFPYFLSWVVASYLLLGLMDNHLGLLNNLLEAVGLEPQGWYNDSKYWPYIFVMMNLWKGIGYTTLLYYASILAIDPQYYEAASIDGASRWQMATRITIPHIMPLIVILTLISIGKIFNANFDMFFNLPRDIGALYSTTDVIDTFVLRTFRVTGDVGMATAAGLFQSVVGLILVLFSNFLVGKVNKENAAF